MGVGRDRPPEHLHCNFSVLEGYCDTMVHNWLGSQLNLPVQEAAATNMVVESYLGTWVPTALQF